jgi:hypothetical protein
MTMLESLNQALRLACPCLRTCLSGVAQLSPRLARVQPEEPNLSGGRCWVPGMGDPRTGTAVYLGYGVADRL